MKKTYNIKIKDLKALLSILELYSNDPIVQVDIIRLSSYIKRYERNFSSQDISLYEKLIDDALELQFYKPFYPLSKEFASLGREQEELNFGTNYSQLKMSDEEAFSNAESFFKEQGCFFHDSFVSFSEEANDHLKFINPNEHTDGEVLTLNSVGEAYMFVPNYSNITKFTILVHETEHIIDFFNNPDFLGLHAIRETAAVFMELIACDYIAEKYKLFDDNFQRRSFIHTITKSQATLLKDKIEMLDLVNNNKSLKPNDLFKLLENRGFTIEDIKFYLSASITEDCSYQLPYLIAVELYTLYYKDKRLALKILVDIIMNANDYNIFDILNKYGIILNKNLLHYEDSLYKKITL